MLRLALFCQMLLCAKILRRSFFQKTVLCFFEKILIVPRAIFPPPLYLSTYARAISTSMATLEMEPLDWGELEFFDAGIEPAAEPSTAAALSYPMNAIAGSRHDNSFVCEPPGPPRRHSPALATPAAAQRSSPPSQPPPLSAGTQWAAGGTQLGNVSSPSCASLTQQITSPVSGAAPAPVRLYG